MSEQLALEIRGMTKSYGRVQALFGIDLDVKRGEIFGFLGPNGAGKTTTIRCLLDLIRPNSGSAKVLGIDPQVDPVAVQARTGYLPGELQLDDSLTAEGHLRYLNSLRGNAADWDFVNQLAGRLNLNLKRHIKNLSKGNKQKVGVIQALMHRPELLLLDEPTAGLDPLMQQEVYRLLKEAKANGATVFFSSHIIGEVEALAERVAIIRNGLIVEEAEPSQLVSMAVRRFRIRFKQPVDLQPLQALTGVTILDQSNGVNLTVQVAGEIDELVKTLATFPISDLETQHPSLEEIFLTFYKDEEEA